MGKNKFSFIQRFRNKIKISNATLLEISETTNIVNCTIFIKGKNNKIIFGNNTRLRGVNIEILGDNSIISIGENTIVGHNTYLSAKEETRLSIGSNCSLSRNIKIMTSDGHPIFQNNKRINSAKDIIIHNNVWITDNVTILKGVNIGQHSIIGINSTVTKSIPNNSIAIGNPAIVKKENITWED